MFNIKFKLYEDYNNGKYVSTFFTYDSDIVLQVEQGDEAFVGTIISVGGEEPSSFIPVNRNMNEFIDKNPNAKGSLKNKKQHKTQIKQK